MKTKKYNSYSTDFKLAVISGKISNYNYNNKYYWNTKGKNKILEALQNDGHKQLAELLLGINSRITNALDELFYLIHRLADKTTKTQQIEHLKLKSYSRKVGA